MEKVLPIRISESLIHRAHAAGLITFRKKRDGMVFEIGDKSFYCMKDSDKKTRRRNQEMLLRQAYMVLNNEPVNTEHYSESADWVYCFEYLVKKMKELEEDVDISNGNLLEYVKCPHCGYHFKTSARKDAHGWHCTCAKCEENFDMKLPEAQYVIVFMDDYDDSSFLDFFTLDGEDEFEAVSCYFMNDKEDFVKKHLELTERPDSMWYGVFVNNHQVCSGACDPLDPEIIVSNCDDKEMGELFEKHGIVDYDFDFI